MATKTGDPDERPCVLRDVPLGAVPESRAGDGLGTFSES
jgi:hypothetical protein